MYITQAISTLPKQAIQVRTLLPITTHPTWGEQRRVVPAFAGYLGALIPGSSKHRFPTTDFGSVSALQAHSGRKNCIVHEHILR
jgi:hypothetical protein